MGQKQQTNNINTMDLYTKSGKTLKVRRVTVIEIDDPPNELSLTISDPTGPEVSASLTKTEAESLIHGIFKLKEKLETTNGTEL